jgi:hypothetical protein
MTRYISIGQYWPREIRWKEPVQKDWGHRTSQWRMTKLHIERASEGWLRLAGVREAKAQSYRDKCLQAEGPLGSPGILMASGIGRDKSLFLSSLSQGRLWWWSSECLEVRGRLVASQGPQFTLSKESGFANGLEVRHGGKRSDPKIWSEQCKDGVAFYHPEKTAKKVFGNCEGWTWVSIGYVGSFWFCFFGSIGVWTQDSRLLGRHSTSWWLWQPAFEAPARLRSRDLE